MSATRARIEAMRQQGALAAKAEVEAEEVGGSLFW